MRISESSLPFGQQPHYSSDVSLVVRRSRVQRQVRSWHAAPCPAFPILPSMAKARVARRGSNMVSVQAGNGLSFGQDDSRTSSDIAFLSFVQSSAACLYLNLPANWACPSVGALMIPCAVSDVSGWIARPARGSRPQSLHLRIYGPFACLRKAVMMPFSRKFSRKLCSALGPRLRHPGQSSPKGENGEKR